MLLTRSGGTKSTLHNRHTERRQQLCLLYVFTRRARKEVALWTPSWLGRKRPLEQHLASCPLTGRKYRDHLVLIGLNKFFFLCRAAAAARRWWRFGRVRWTVCLVGSIRREKETTKLVFFFHVQNYASYAQIFHSIDVAEGGKVRQGMNLFQTAFSQQRFLVVFCGKG